MSVLTLFVSGNMFCMEEKSGKPNQQKMQTRQPESLQVLAIRNLKLDTVEKQKEFIKENHQLISATLIQVLDVHNDGNPELTFMIALSSVSLGLNAIKAYFNSGPKLNVCRVGHVNFVFQEIIESCLDPAVPRIVIEEKQRSEQ